MMHMNSIGGARNCVSREEFDTLQKELNYWQNTTINLLKKYLIDNEGTGTKISLRSTYNIAEHAYIHTEDQSSHCSLSDDSFLKDKVEELDQKVEGILNQTQGIDLLNCGFTITKLSFNYVFMQIFQL